MKAYYVTISFLVIMRGAFLNEEACKISETYHIVPYDLKIMVTS